MPLNLMAEVVCQRSGDERCVKQPSVVNSESLTVTVWMHGGGGGGGGWFGVGATTLRVLLMVVVCVGFWLLTCPVVGDLHFDGVGAGGGERVAGRPRGRVAEGSVVVQVPGERVAGVAAVAAPERLAA